MSQEKTDLQDEGQSSPGSDTEPTRDQQADTAHEAPAADAAAGQQQPRAEQPEAQADDTDAQTATDELSALREALQQARDEADSHREQALRATAELENVRKRGQRDVESARKYALEKFATELLGVRDSLEMGLKANEEAGGDVARLTEGMELTGRMLASAMEKFGVEAVNPEGEVFDPELHEAVSTHETDAQAPNTVVSVMQKGYTLNGRVLRAAMVVVAKAPSGDS